MIAAAEVGADDHVLEVGAGSGYAAAVIGQVARDVIAVERHGELARLAAERMAELGYANVRIVEGDGMLGWPEAAPYDAILVAASGRHVPPALVEQLKPGGRLVIPLGGRWAGQTLVKLTKRDDGTLERDAPWRGAVRAAGRRRVSRASYPERTSKAVSDPFRIRIYTNFPTYLAMIGDIEKGCQYASLVSAPDRSGAGQFPRRERRTARLVHRPRCPRWAQLARDVRL